jgi:cytochrome b561
METPLPTKHDMAAPAEPRYGLVAMALHWLLALTIVGTFSVGLYMHDLPFSVTRVKLFNWHKWAGITILVLSALRLLWRLSHRPPPLPAPLLAAMPRWQQGAHHGTHRAMYLLFFAVPLFGWAYSSAVGLQIVWFGVLPLPDLMSLDKELGNGVLKPLHRASAFLLGGLVVLHVAAALKHQFVDRDGLLSRMWPGTR